MSEFFCASVPPRLLVLICFFLVHSKEAALADSEEAVQILRSRVSKEVGKLSESFQAKAITIENKSESVFQGGAKSETVDLIKKHGEWYVMVIENKSGASQTDPEFSYAINSKYSFELTKKRPGTAWLLSKVVFVTPDFDEKKAHFTLLLEGGFRHIVDNYISSLTAIWMVHRSPADGGVETEKLFDLPGFQLNSVSLDATNQNTLRANFDYDVTEPTSKKVCRSNCVVEYDLGMHCLPTRLHQTYKVGSRKVVHEWRRNWVKKGNDNYTVTVAVDMDNITDGITKQIFRVRSNVAVSMHDLPESDFTLSAFGFPEPPGVEWSKPFPWYLMVTGIGMACLGAFFFLRARARRLRV